jgi:hypothetical protein
MRDHNRTGADFVARPKASGFTAMGIFLFFGATMATLAATTLLCQGTPLDRIWWLNPIAYKQLAPLGSMVGILFLLLGMFLTAAGIGWFRRRLWRWRLAVVISSIQLLGDVVNFVRVDWLRGGTGVIIAGLFLWFLLRSESDPRLPRFSLTETQNGDNRLTRQKITGAAPLRFVYPYEFGQELKSQGLLQLSYL